MTSDQRKKLSEIKQFKQLIAYLRDEMGWPIKSDSDFEELTYEYTTTELGIDDKSAAQIQEIKRLRPLSAKQPWGVFFVKFEPKKLPVVALRRILGQVALKKRASANPADRTMWAQEDLLFISNYGEGDDRQITLAHFSVPTGGHTLPSLKVLGWDSKDTVLHLEAVARELTEQLSWPADESDADAWRAKWRAAFTLGHQEVITTSKALSIRLAQLARDIRDRIETALKIETDDGPLTRLMKAFQESLIHDLTPADFADMYAQTIAYGLLSSRIADPKKNSVDDLAARMQLSPFLKELMETFLQVGGRNKHTGIDFDELGVGEVVDLLDRANMEAVVADFGDKNPEEDPVIHFYELFLKEYDAKKRMSRGVFYTPRPIVSYIVRSVHELLKSEFGLPDGLADTSTWRDLATKNKNLQIPTGVSPDSGFVQILDPATGTGTFLVEIIDVIHKTLVSKWQHEGQDSVSIEQSWNEYVATHLLSRLHGYELMMAPYAIAQLKVSLKLFETGYRILTGDRAQVLLTNSLEPSQDYSDQLSFTIPALAHEAVYANAIKANTRYTVIVGNPPYASISSNLTASAKALIEPYRYLHGEKIVERGALAFERNLNDDYVKFLRLAESQIEQSFGIVGYITNNGYLEAPTLRGLRAHLADTFDAIAIVDLHGDSDRREKAPDGQNDENVFDIKRGVSIGLFRRKLPGSQERMIRRIDLLGSRDKKYEWLGSSAFSPDQGVEISPTRELFQFIHEDAGLAQEYSNAFAIDEIFDFGRTGFETGRDELLIDFTETELLSKISEFVNGTDAVVREKYSVDSGWGENLYARRHSLADTGASAAKVIRVLVYPYDWRYCFYRTDLLQANSWSVGQHLQDGKNLALVCMRQVVLDGPFTHAMVSSAMVNNRVFASQKGKASYFPLLTRHGNGEGLFEDDEGLANVRVEIAKQLFRSTPALELDPRRLMALVVAQLNSPQYRNRYQSQLVRNYPRVFIPKSAELLEGLIALGDQLINVQLFQTRKLDEPVARYSGPPNQVIGEVKRIEQTVWVDKSRKAGFIGVSDEVWEFEIGGYKVCQKWLKDRRGRILSTEDSAHYMRIVAAITETIRLSGEIDSLINQFGGLPDAFY